MNVLDLIIILLYFVVVFYIAIKANFFIKAHRKEGLSNEIECQYLAGKTVTYWECLFSICAASVSAFHFLVLPGLVFAGNMSYLQFILGAIVSRPFIAYFILPNIHSRGLTVIEAVARGNNNYQQLSVMGSFGRKMLSLVYFLFKVMDVGLKLYLGSLLVAAFFGHSVVLSMIGLCLMTYAYTIIGGLKAVVRTDIMQFFLFLFAGLVVPFVISSQSNTGIGELTSLAFTAGKFSLCRIGGIGSFVVGIMAGIIYDVAGTGCDQEIVQKLFATSKKEWAQKALKHSAWITVLAQSLLLFIGALLWSFVKVKGISLSGGEGAFYRFILEYIPSPLKGLLVAGAMAAVMSSLDSAINALSTIYWNDIMPNEEAKNIGLYIKLDMMIIAQIILFCGCMINSLPTLRFASDSISHWATAPLLALIIGRAGLFHYLKIEFNPAIIFFSYGASFFGLLVARVYFKADINFAVVISVISSFLALKAYSHLTHHLHFKATE